jgi:hypothetical protein
MKPQGIKKNEIITRDMLSERISSMMSEEGLNIADGEYFYIKTVGNHIVVGRAKIIIEE